MEHRQLQFISWNCQSIKPKLNELALFLICHNIDIVLLSETWLKPEIKFSISGFDCYRCDRSTGSSNPHGGVAILVNKNICHKLIKFGSTKSIESIFIQIPSENCNITIGCVYCPPRVDVDFKGEFASLLASPGPLIISGDFNAKYAAWNNIKNDSRGKMIYDLCLQNNFSIFSPNGPTLISPRGSPSVLDFVI
jgi:exonuclease III